MTDFSDPNVVRADGCEFTPFVVLSQTSLT